MIRIIVGTERSQYLPQKVLEFSIKKQTKEKIDIKFVTQTKNRVGGTNFGFVRFHVPYLCNYSGKAIYLDADQLLLDDINKLYQSLDSDHAIALVNNPKGFFGKKTVGNHNQTSVMVLNCDQLLDWNPDKMFTQVKPNRKELTNKEIHYRDFMMLTWFDSNKIVSLNPKWNHFNVVLEDTSLVHFSHVKSQPWKNPQHELANYWGTWLSEAIKNKHIKRTELLNEIFRGHIHRHYLRYIF